MVFRLLAPLVQQVQEGKIFEDISSEDGVDDPYLRGLMPMLETHFPKSPAIFISVNKFESKLKFPKSKAVNKPDEDRTSRHF